MENALKELADAISGMFTHVAQINDAGGEAQAKLIREKFEAVALEAGKKAG